MGRILVEVVVGIPCQHHKQNLYESISIEMFPFLLIIPYHISTSTPLSQGGVPSRMVRVIVRLK